MNKTELDKNFAFAGKDGICAKCAYVNICNMMLPGYNKPGKCGGPFHNDKNEHSSLLQSFE